MSFETKKLNKEFVEKVPSLQPADARPIKGFNLFPEIYANVFLCAKKKSGKTSVINKILESCCGPDTVIVVFCSTLEKDDSWNTIRTWAESKGIQFIGHTEIKQGKEDLLDNFITSLQAPDVAEEEEPTPRHLFNLGEEEEEPEKKKKKKEKFRSPEYIFVFDDISPETRLKSVTTFLKKNRHFKCKVLISSQHPNDLMPAARKQLNYFILFKGHPVEKLKQIHIDADLAMRFEDFVEMYRFATEQPFSFLYIDTDTGKFRRNFCDEISFSPDSA